LHFVLFGDSGISKFEVLKITAKPILTELPCDQHL